MSRPERRRLIVTGCRQIASGAGDHGEWRLHQIEATTRDGKPIGARIVSFESFEPGGVDVFVERQDHPEHGVSYRVRRPRASAAALAGRVDQLERALAEIVARVDQLETAAAVNVKEPT